MKVRVDIPFDKIDETGTYFGVENGGVYELSERQRQGDSYKLNFSFGVLVYKDWCTEISDYKIELDEDLFKL